MATHSAIGYEPQRLLQAWLTHSREGVIWLSPAGVVVEWSDAAARMWGIPRAEVVGHHWSELEVAGALPIDTQRTYRTVREVTLPEHAESPGMSILAVTDNLSDESGRFLGTLTLVRPVQPAPEAPKERDDRKEALAAALRALRKSHEELQQAQLQLIQAARLESVGRLAAGVAHEVKNPLAVILAAIGVLQQRGVCEGPNLELLGEMEGAVRRANGVVMGLLDFAAATALKLEYVRLQEVVTKAVEFVRHDAAMRQLHIQQECNGDPPSLRIDRTKLEQVLINFLMNAMDATKPGGTITVRTSLQQLRRAGPDVGYRKTDLLHVGQTVAAIEVEDTGTGLPPEVLKRAFEPFFTTKGPGKGTGLGLAVCKMIAGLHRGSVWLENRAEGGTRATLWLPAGELHMGVPHDEAQDPAR